MSVRVEPVFLVLMNLGPWGLAACDDGAQAPRAADDATVASPDTDTGSGGEPEVATSEPPPDAGAPDAGVPGELAPPARGFQIESPPIVIASASEATYCYYFTLPIEEAVGVKRWESLMTPGSHHLIVYFTGEAMEPDGTVTLGCDGFGGGISNVPVWTYSTQTRHNVAEMPPGVGMHVEAQQHGFVQMHYLNPTLEDLEVVVKVNGETFEPGEPYQQAAAFVTYHTGIQIPAGVGQTAFAEGSCRVKSGIRFFALSTHAHKRAVKTAVHDDDDLVFESDDWEHPGIQVWDDGYTFGGNMRYRCDYVNDRDAVVTTGQSAESDEMCMAVGYFYPAQRPIFCINSLVVSQ